VVEKIFEMCLKSSAVQPDESATSSRRKPQRVLVQEFREEEFTERDDELQHQLVSEFKGKKCGEKAYETTSERKVAQDAQRQRARAGLEDRTTLSVPIEVRVSTASRERARPGEVQRAARARRPACAREAVSLAGDPAHDELRSASADMKCEKSQNVMKERLQNGMVEVVKWKIENEGMSSGVLSDVGRMRDDLREESDANRNREFRQRELCVVTEVERQCAQCGVEPVRGSGRDSILGAVPAAQQGTAAAQARVYRAEAPRSQADRRRCQAEELERQAKAPAGELDERGAVAFVVQELKDFEQEIGDIVEEIEDIASESLSSMRELGHQFQDREGEDPRKHELRKLLKDFEMDEMRVARGLDSSERAPGAPDDEARMRPRCGSCEGAWTERRWTKSTSTAGAPAARQAPARQQPPRTGEEPREDHRAGRPGHRIRRRSHRHR